MVGLTIGVLTVATCAPTWLMVERNKNSANCDELSLRCGEPSATTAVRKEVNVQCVK